MELTDTAPLVLIVDDTPANLQVLGTALRNEGHRIIVAQTGLQALEVVEKVTPDLILLDVMMPGIDGFETCKRLKEKRDTEDIPIIFLTAKTETEDIVRGFELGAVDYVTKPFNATELLARCRTHLTLRHYQRQLEAQNEELREAARLREDVEQITRHDLKAPLNMIMGYPQLLAKKGDNLTEDQKEGLRSIEDAGRRMLEMINRSLDLFKMERGIYACTPVPVDLLPILDQVAVETQTTAATKNLSVEVVLNGGPPAVHDTFIVPGEALLFYSMLANLLKNAVEASPEGERVTIALSAGDEATVRIRNKGTVPPDMRDRFFEKYATSGKRHGTGLGTYSAKLAAETQGGSIRMEASEEDGTTITTSFPPAADTSLF